MDALGSYPINFSTGRVPISTSGDESKNRPIRRNRMVQAAAEWLKRRSTVAKIAIAAAATVLALVTLKVTVKDHNYVRIGQSIRIA